MRKNIGVFFIAILATVTVLVMGISLIQAQSTEIQAAENETQVETTSQQTNGWVTVKNKTYYYENGVKAVGWRIIKNNKYYFNKYAVMQTGLKKIDGSKYYFNTKGKMQTGFKKIKGYKYFFNTNGKMQIGLKKINNAYYYFDKTGKMKKGSVSIKKSKYFFNNNGQGVVKGWVKCSDNKKRYGLGKGKISIGSKKIGKKVFFFNPSNGTLKKTKGMFTYKKKKYYCKGKGVLFTGYKAFNGKKKYAMYFSKKTGKQVKGKKVGHLKIPKSGKLSAAYVYGINLLNKRGWKLRKAYNYSKNLHYAWQKFRASSCEKYALKGFKTGYGNCYVMAATFYIQAKLLGYDARQMSGAIGSAPHSWVVIKHKKKSLVYDPDFQHEKGRNGYKIWYGKPGTWVYTIGRRIG